MLCGTYAAVHLCLHLLPSNIFFCSLSLCHKTNQDAKHYFFFYLPVCVYPSLSLWTKPCCSYSSPCSHRPKATIWRSLTANPLTLPPNPCLAAWLLKPGPLCMRVPWQWTMPPSLFPPQHCLILVASEANYGVWFQIHLRVLTFISVLVEIFLGMLKHAVPIWPEVLLCEGFGLGGGLNY